MSKSIADLLGNVDLMGSRQPTPTNQLYNPDVPDGQANTIAGNVNNRKVLIDKYYSSMKLGRNPRNGEVFNIGRNNGKLSFENPRNDSFMCDNSMDPNTIRQQTDPDSAMPSSYINGSLYNKYKLPVSGFTPTDKVNLLQKATESYYNYKNRFSMVPEQEIQR